jgi:hypothetical protein
VPPLEACALHTSFLIKNDLIRGRRIVESNIKEHFSTSLEVVLFALYDL